MAAKYHSSLRTLPVWNFYEVVNTGDKKYLWIDEPGKEDLTEVWKDIYDEFCEKAGIDNRNMKQYLKVSELIFKYKGIAALVEVVIKGHKEERKEAVQLLKDKRFGVLIDLRKALKPQIESINKRMSSLATKIKIEEAKIPKEEKKQAVNVMKQAIALENIFQGRNIDIYTMPMEKWLALVDAGNEKVKAQKEIRK